MNENELLEIEKKIAEINLQISSLEQQKDALLPEDYLFYRDDWYPQHYDDEPLSLRSYYQAMSELEKLNRLFLTEADIDSAWQKYGKRLQELERGLAA